MALKKVVYFCGISNAAALSTILYSADQEDAMVLLTYYIDVLGRVESDTSRIPKGALRDVGQRSPATNAGEELHYCLSLTELSRSGFSVYGRLLRARQGDYTVTFHLTKNGQKIARMRCRNLLSL